MKSSLTGDAIFLPEAFSMVLKTITQNAREIHSIHLYQYPPVIEKSDSDSEEFVDRSKELSVNRLQFDAILLARERQAL